MTTLHADPTARAAALQGRRGVREDWIRFVVATMARIVIAATIGGLFWASAPALIGWKPTTVMSDSMAPRFFAGDVVVSMPVSETMDVTGHIVLVDDPDHAGRLRLHRAVAVDADGALITRGDANPADDSSHVARTAVRGVGILRVPLVGLPVLWAKEGNLAGLGALGLGAAMLLVLASLDADLRRERSVPRIRMRRRTPRYGLAVGGAAGVAALALVASTGAHAAFSAPSLNPANAWTATSSFGTSCWGTGSVADSPLVAYRYDDAPATTTVDSSGNARTGAVGSGATRTTVACGAGNPATALDGTSASTVIAGGSTAGLGSTFSLEAWVKVASGTTGGSVVSWRPTSSTTASQALYISAAGRPVVQYQGALGVPLATSSVSIADSAWHHIVGTSSSDGFGTVTLTVYVDGASRGSNVIALNAAGAVTGSARVGYDTSRGPAAGLVGQVDDTAVYATTLSASRVAAHYAAGR